MTKDSFHFFILFFLFFQLEMSWGENLIPQSSMNESYKESLYHRYRESLLNKKFDKISQRFLSDDTEQFVDALWDLVDEGLIIELKFIKKYFKRDFYHQQFSLFNKIRLEFLTSLHSDQERFLKVTLKEVEKLLHFYSLDTDERKKILKLQSHSNFYSQITDEDFKKSLYFFWLYEKDISDPKLLQLIQSTKKKQWALSHFAETLSFDHFKSIIDEISPISSNSLKDLILNSLPNNLVPPFTRFIRLFMLCRKDRSFPCLMLMKDQKNNLVRDEQGEVWTHKGLGASIKNIPSYKINGHTPQGVYTMDSVMPYANQRITFGKYRRIILNFIPASPKENSLTSLIPESSRLEKWWMESVFARDIGRKYLRIHGTGKKNQYPQRPYYPFMKTLGCIAQRENTYGKIYFKDQKDLLQKILKEMDLAPIYQNEPLIRGLLYVVNIDDKKAPVTWKDIAYLNLD